MLKVSPIMEGVAPDRVFTDIGHLRWFNKIKASATDRGHQIAWVRCLGHTHAGPYVQRHLAAFHDGLWVEQPRVTRNGRLHWVGWPARDSYEIEAPCTDHFWEVEGPIAFCGICGYRISLEMANLLILRPYDEWHEDRGSVLWWTWPICEPPWCGTPLDSDWPDYHTHWSPLPDCNLMGLGKGAP